MDYDRYIQEMENLDLRSVVDSWAAKDETHPSYKYRFQHQAVIAEVPTPHEMAGDTIWPVVIQANLDAILGASKLWHGEQKNILNRHNALNSMAGWKYPTSTQDFYQGLTSLANDAKTRWTVLSIWISQQGYGVEVPIDWHSWQDLASAYWEDESPEEVNPADFGMMKATHFIKPSDTWVPDFEASEDAIKAWIPSDMDAEACVHWFQNNISELNLMYRHSVNLINWDAFQDILLYEEMEGIDCQEVEGSVTCVRLNGSEEPYTYAWWKKPKDQGDGPFDSNHRFINRYTEAHYLGKSFNLGDHHIETVISMVKRAGEMDRTLYQYMDAVKDLVSKKESTVFGKTEIDDWVEWFDKRSAWYHSYTQVRSWLYNQYDAPCDKLTLQHYQSMVHLQNDVRIKESTLEHIKADQMMVTQRAKKSVGQTAYQRYKEFIEKEEDALEKEGFYPKLFQQAEWEAMQKDIKFDRQRFDNWMLNKSNEGASGIGEQWLAALMSEIEKDEGERIKRLAHLDHELIAYQEGPNKDLYFKWLEALADEDGMCSRKKIGYERVNEGSKESAMRNAGKRFVESETMCLPYPLEPVKWFEETDLLDALAIELTKQLKAEKLPPQSIKYIVKDFRGQAKGRSEMVMITHFVVELTELKMDNEEIRVRIKDALKLVGKKRPTNRTLYDARHVALAFCLDEKMVAATKNGTLPKSCPLDLWEEMNKSRRNRTAHQKA